MAKILLQRERRLEVSDFTLTLRIFRLISMTDKLNFPY